ncbi:hypothetical protein [Allopontixanthobacter confluentis]
MDPNLLLIFSFILVVIMVSFGLGGAIHKRDLAFKQRKLELEAARAGADSPASAKKIEQLEQRVRVLERLATDRGQDLALQIESLRGPASADALPAELTNAEQRQRA